MFFMSIRFFMIYDMTSEPAFCQYFLMAISVFRTLFKTCGLIGRGKSHTTLNNVKNEFFGLS